MTDLHTEDRPQEAPVDEAYEIRMFLAGVRPIDGCCFCGNDSFHAGRGHIERLAIAQATESTDVAPSLVQCLDIIEYLTCIRPHSKEFCYGCAGGAEQVGLNVVLEHIALRIRECVEVEAANG